MKVFFTVCILLTSFCAMAKTISLKDIAGTYEVTLPEYKMTNLVSIKSNGVLTFYELSREGFLKCKGKAQIEGSIVNTRIKCKINEEKSTKFEQEIDLSEVKQFTNFKAPVTSTLFGPYSEAISMSFVKLTD